MGGQLYAGTSKTPGHGGIQITGSHICGIKFINISQGRMALQNIVKWNGVSIYVGQHISVMCFLISQSGRIPLESTSINTGIEIRLNQMDAVGNVIQYRLPATRVTYGVFQALNISRDFSWLTSMMGFI